MKMSKVGIFAVLAALAMAGTAEAAVKKKVSSSKAKKPVAAALLAPADDNQKFAADRVYYGQYDCEFKQKITLDKDDVNPGYVKLKYGKQAWTMKPELSMSGAVNMVDVKGGSKMLQIANKSMIFNTKTGQRMVDGCMSTEQTAMAQQLSQKPTTGSALFDAPEPAAVATPQQ